MPDGLSDAWVRLSVKRFHLGQTGLSHHCIMEHSQPPEAPVREIHWFLTAYVMAEDRLRFSCTLKTGDTDILWVTQRLAKAVIVKLLEWLDKQTVQDSLGTDAPHRMAQQSALAKRPNPPAKPIPEGVGWLVHSVGIRTVGKSILLTFKDDGEKAVAIRFDAQHLRQWLSVLHAQYRRSGWPTDIWPEWLAGTASDQSIEHSGLLH